MFYAFCVIRVVYVLTVPFQDKDLLVFAVIVFYNMRVSFS